MGDRELIATRTDKRYVRRDNEGRFSKSDDVGKSLAAHVRRPAKTEEKPGKSDCGGQ